MLYSCKNKQTVSKMKKRHAAETHLWINPTLVHTKAPQTEKTSWDKAADAQMWNLSYFVLLWSTYRRIFCWEAMCCCKIWPAEPQQMRHKVISQWWSSLAALVIIINTRYIHILTLSQCYCSCPWSVLQTFFWIMYIFFFVYFKHIYALLVYVLYCIYATCFLLRINSWI